MHEDLQQFPVAAKVLPYSEYTVKLLHNLIKAKTCTQQDTDFTHEHRSSLTQQHQLQLSTRRQR